MMLRAIWRLSRPETFIPNFSPPGTWAESSAASPRTTTRPLPKLKAMPWMRLAAETAFLIVERVIDGGVGQFEDRDAPRRTLERRAGEGLDLVDPLGVVAPPG